MSRAALLAVENHSQLKFISNLVPDREHRYIIIIQISNLFCDQDASKKKTNKKNARLIFMQVSPHLLGK